MVVNFQKNALDLHMTFYGHNDLEFDLDHDFEGQENFFETLPLFLIAKLIKN